MRKLKGKIKNKKRRSSARANKRNVKKRERLIHENLKVLKEKLDNGKLS
jgi:hypothetical protein